MKAGDWVVVYRSVWDRTAGRYVEAAAVTVRIARRTPTQIRVERSTRVFKQTCVDGSVWEVKGVFFDGTPCLRPATPEEAQRAEEAERQRTEAEQKRKDAVNAMRVVLAQVCWADIDDMTVEVLHRMATDARNRKA